MGSVDKKTPVADASTRAPKEKSPNAIWAQAQLGAVPKAVLFDAILMVSS